MKHGKNAAPAKAPSYRAPQGPTIVIDMRQHHSPGAARRAQLEGVAHQNTARYRPR